MVVTFGTNVHFYFQMKSNFGDLSLGQEFNLSNSFKKKKHMQNQIYLCLWLTAKD